MFGEPLTWIKADTCELLGHIQDGVELHGKTKARTPASTVTLSSELVSEIAWDTLHG
jgi:hypothetical protein